MENGVHSIVFHVGINSRNPTHDIDVTLGITQVNIILILEAFRVVLYNFVSAAEVIRPPGLDVIHYCDRGNIFPPTQYISEF